MSSNICYVKELIHVVYFSNNNEILDALLELLIDILLEGGIDDETNEYSLSKVLDFDARYGSPRNKHT